MVRINGDGISVNQNSETKQKNTEKVQNQNTDESIFNTTNSDTENDIVSQIVKGVLDELLFDGTFTKDEAKTYVEGEKEIAKMVEEEKQKQLDGGHYLTYLFDSAKTEKDCRDKYAKENPEYKEVMKEGQKVESQYETAYDDAKTKWLEENPEPKGFEEGGLFGIKETDEHKEWRAKEKEFSKGFEEEYIKNNPDYGNLKDAQKSDMSFWEALADS